MISMSVIGRITTGEARLPPGSFLAELDAPAWMSEGLCAQTDPEAFFPDKGGSTRQAKAICHTCDVRDQCLAYALEHEERYGIWGGLSERERRKINRQQNRHRTCYLTGCAVTFITVKGGPTKYCCPDHSREALRRRAAGLVI